MRPSHGLSIIIAVLSLVMAAERTLFGAGCICSPNKFVVKGGVESSTHTPFCDCGRSVGQVDRCYMLWVQLGLCSGKELEASLC